jgi:hypothetical protein
MVVARPTELRCARLSRRTRVHQTERLFTCRIGECTWDRILSSRPVRSAAGHFPDVVFLITYAGTIRSRLKNQKKTRPIGGLRHGGMDGRKATGSACVTAVPGSTAKMPLWERRRAPEFAPRTAAFVSKMCPRAVAYTRFRRKLIATDSHRNQRHSPLPYLLSIS